MSWFKVDDKFYDHPKARKAGKAAIGVWTLAGTWCADHLTDGFVPAGVLPRWGTRGDAKKLVDAGLWEADTFDGEPGWRFRKWADYQPTRADKKAEREAARERQRKGREAQKSRRDSGVVTDMSQRDTGEPSQTRHGGPDPTRPVPVVPDGTTTSTLTLAEAPPRSDVERICQHLQDRIAGNGSKRPTITKGWRDAARLMLDKDDRDEDDVHKAIDWCQNDEFWRANILSLPTLREQYDRLRLAAQRGTTVTARRRPNDDIDWEAAAQRAAARDAQEATS